jgi:beta-phosphoglucomutase-like phosphatase (HAD superfamily)
MLKAVIFDVDGTLLGTERIYMYAWKAAAAELGYVMSDELLRKTRAVDARVAAKTFEEEIGNGFCYQTARPVRVRIAEEIIQSDNRWVCFLRKGWGRWKTFPCNWWGP